MHRRYGLDQQSGRPPQETDMGDHKLPETVLLGIDHGDLFVLRGVCISRDIAESCVAGYGRFHEVTLAKAPRGQGSPLAFALTMLERAFKIKSSPKEKRSLDGSERRFRDVTGTLPALTVFRGRFVRYVLQKVARCQRDAIHGMTGRGAFRLAPSFRQT